MKLLTYLVIIFLAFAGTAFAGPFLVTDAPSTPTYCDGYEVYIDGTLYQLSNDIEPDGSLKFDLVAVVPGEYEFTAKCCKAGNDWGCSDLSNPYLSDPVLLQPAGLRMVKQ